MARSAPCVRRWEYPPLISQAKFPKAHSNLPPRSRPGEGGEVSRSPTSVGCRLSSPEAFVCAGPHHPHPAWGGELTPISYETVSRRGPVSNDARVARGAGRLLSENDRSPSHEFEKWQHNVKVSYASYCNAVVRFSITARETSS